MPKSSVRARWTVRRRDAGRAHGRARRAPQRRLYERAVCVGVFFEDSAHHLSYAAPAGATSAGRAGTRRTSSGYARRAVPPQARARRSEPRLPDVTRRPCSSARAPCAVRWAHTPPGIEHVVEIELPVGCRDLLGVGRTAVRLRLERRDSSMSFRSRAATSAERCAHLPSIELADLERLLRRDRPGVQRLDCLVDRHARLLVAGQDRALHRGGTAPARQQRRMHVQPERAFEQARRDVEAVRADDDAVGVSRKLGLLRLMNRDSELRGDELRGRRTELPATASRRVGARQEPNDLVLLREVLPASRRAAPSPPRRIISAGRREAAASRALPCGTRRAGRSMIRTPSRWSSSCCTTWSRGVSSSDA